MAFTSVSVLYSNKSYGTFVYGQTQLQWLDVSPFHPKRKQALHPYVVKAGRPLSQATNADLPNARAPRR